MTRIGFIMIVIICLIVPTTFIYCKTIRVSQDYRTIQEAINASVNGDTILISEDDDLLYEKGISFNAEKESLYVGPVPKKDLLIIGEAEDKNTIDAHETRPSTWVFKVNAEGVVFENLILRGAKFGLNVEDAAPMLINCIAENNDYGLYISGLSNALPNPIYLFNTSVTNNIQCIESTVDKFVFLNSCFSDNQSGISIVNANPNSKISNCVIKNNGSYGIDIKGEYRGNLSNNVFDNNSNAINVKAEVSSVFVNTAKVLNNIFIDNGYPDGYAIFVNPLDDFKANYTCFYNNREKYNKGTDTVSTINADPKFTANRDCEDYINSYQLQPDSPCIDAGNIDPSWNDFDGSRGDIGARGGPAMNLALNLYITHSYWAWAEFDTGSKVQGPWREIYRSAEYLEDTWIPNGKWDREPFSDSNNNDMWDPGEGYTDTNHNGKYDSEKFTDYFDDRVKNAKIPTTERWAWEGKMVWNKNVWNGDDTLCIGYFIVNPNTTSKVDLYFAIYSANNNSVFFVIKNEDGTYGASAALARFRALELSPNNIFYDKVVIPITKDVPGGEYRIAMAMAYTGTTPRTVDDFIGGRDGIQFYPPETKIGASGDKYYENFIIQHPNP